MAREDEGDSSVGSIVAFAGSLAGMFMFEPAFAVIRGLPYEDVGMLTFAALGLLLAISGIVLARHKPGGGRPSQRVLAASGLWLSRVSLLVGIPTIIILLKRVAFGMP